MSCHYLGTTTVRSLNDKLLAIIHRFEDPNQPGHYVEFWMTRNDGAAPEDDFHLWLLNTTVQWKFVGEDRDPNLDTLSAFRTYAVQTFAAENVPSSKIRLWVHEIREEPVNP